MWKLLAAVACVSAVSAAPVPKDFKKPDDQAQLVGTWTMTRCNVGGRDDDDRSWEALTFDADGGVRATFRDGRLVLDYRTAIDPAATPRRMSWQNPKTREAQYECVYQIAAGRLTVAIPHDHKTPPASLEIGPQVTVFEFKRADAK